MSVIKVRLFLWWVKYHWLNFAHITYDNPLSRLAIFEEMKRHDERHPTGNAPDW